MAFQRDKSVNIFFALLRSGLYGTPVPEAELPESIDWPAIISYAQKQAVYGVIIESVQFLPERLRPQANIAAKMNKFALGLIQANLIVDQTVAQLVIFLKQHGFKGVLLKGQGVARFYRLPQMRQNGDIDFYIGKAIYKQATELCRDQLSDDKDACFQNDKHFDLFIRDIPIELHRVAAKIFSPIRRKRFQDWCVYELEHSPHRRTVSIGNTDVTLPSYDFDALFIFYHAWCHYIMGGIGLRQLCDWAMIFHNHAADIDTERLKENIRRFGITKGWKLFACIAVKYLGVPADKMPLYEPAYHKKSEKIMDEILVGGNFGRYTKANTRTPMYGYGLWHGLGKVRNITGYFFSLFPLIPLEATFLYFHRLYHGTIDCTKRTIQHLKK